MAMRAEELLGSIWLEKKDDEQARLHFNRVLAVAPRNSLAQYGLGWIATQEGKWDDALQHLRAALDIDPQLLGQGGVPLARRGQFRARLNQPLDDHGHHEFPFPTALGGEHRLQAELADHPQHGFDVTVREGAPGGEQVLGGDEGLVVQQAAQGFDLVHGPVGEVGEGALAGLGAFAPAFAEEDGGRGVAVGDGFDVHGNNCEQVITHVNSNI